MSKFVLDDRLKKYVGKATTAAEQVTAIFSKLEKTGQKFKVREADSIQEKGKVLAVLVELEDAIKRSGLTKRVITDMRKRLPKHKGEGERRADKRQSFCSLALECFYGLRRSSISRFTRVIKKLKVNEVSPRDFGKVLREKGGIEEYLNPDRKKSSAASVASGGKEGAEQTGITITVCPKVQKALGKLKDGDVVAGVGMQKKGNRVRLVMLTRDPAVCNLMARFIEKGKLLKTSGIDPKNLHLRRLKLDTSTLSSALH